MTRYTCKTCGAPAQIKDDAVVKSCACDAPIIAHLKATATGEAWVAKGK
jgi:hypothetical protein